MTKDIKEILENVMYWDTCPDDYKVKIKNYLSSLEENTKKNITHAHAYVNALNHFNNITKEDILELYTQLDCVYEFLELHGIVDRYSKNEILKDFVIVKKMGDTQCLKIVGTDKLVTIPVNSIINEITNIFKDN